eukprot:gene19989-7084_t
MKTAEVIEFVPDGTTHTSHSGEERASRERQEILKLRKKIRELEFRIDRRATQAAITTLQQSVKSIEISLGKLPTASLA